MQRNLQETTKIAWKEMVGVNKRIRLNERQVDNLLLITTAAVFFVVWPFGGMEKALASAVIFGVFSAIIQAKWGSRRDKRFWLVISVFAVVHIVALSLIQIPELRMGLISLPIALVDGFAMYRFINWIEKKFPNANHP
jgi:hypothetical protein